MNCYVMLFSWNTPKITYFIPDGNQENTVPGVLSKVESIFGLDPDIEGDGGATFGGGADGGGGKEESST